MFEILKARARKQGLMIGEGTLEVMPDGALLVSDDQAGVIYRISYNSVD